MATGLMFRSFKHKKRKVTIKRIINTNVKKCIQNQRSMTSFECFLHLCLCFRLCL